MFRYLSLLWSRTVNFVAFINIRMFIYIVHLPSFLWAYCCCFYCLLVCCLDLIQSWQLPFISSIKHSFTAGCSIIAEAHICILKQRWDPSYDRERWSLPTSERCLCTHVFAPKFGSIPRCSEDTYVEPGDLWFTDNPELLKNKLHWTKNDLDESLERAEFCSE